MHQIPTAFCLVGFPSPVEKERAQARAQVKDDSSFCVGCVAQQTRAVWATAARLYLVTLFYAEETQWQPRHRRPLKETLVSWKAEARLCYKLLVRPNGPLSSRLRPIIHYKASEPLTSERPLPSATPGRLAS